MANQKPKPHGVPDENVYDNMHWTLSLRCWQSLLPYICLLWQDK